ncbi:MbeB family mobilization protein [Pseudoalteromonas marina]|uniref:MbeB family mobilization protein n=1 Tax=Pseudoalteromonas marina TaxID=267375 RepID=UPI003BB50FE6
MMLSINFNHTAWKSPEKPSHQYQLKTLQGVKISDLKGLYMSEILKAAQTLQQRSQEQSKAIKEIATKDFQGLRKHLQTHIKQSEKQITKDIDSMVAKAQEHQTNTTYSALMVFLLGLIFGSGLTLGVIVAIQKLNIQ